MRRIADLKKAVVGLLRAAFRCEVKETSGSLNLTDCLVNRLDGDDLPMPIGLCAFYERQCLPVHLRWLLARRKSFGAECSIVYASIADGLDGPEAALAIHQELRRHGPLLEPGSLIGLRIYGRDCSEVVDPEAWLEQLEAERFAVRHSRRNGQAVRVAGGRLVIRSSRSRFGIGPESLPPDRFGRVGRLHDGGRVSFRPLPDSGPTPMAGEIHFPCLHRRCA